MKKLYISILILFITSTIFPQQDYDFVNSDIGVSHEDFSNFSESFTIPLYTIQVAGLTVPIYLSYNTMGRKNSDAPSSVGFGWQLHAGGKIEKQINHLPDESYFGWFNTDINGDISRPFGSNGEQSYYELDVEPDVFYMSLSNGDNATFLYDKLNSPSLRAKIFNQNRNYNIYTNFNSINYDYDEQYTDSYDYDIRVNNDANIKYYFRKGSKRRSPYDYQRRPRTKVDSMLVSDFYIHKIESSQQNEFIYFDYVENELEKYFVHSSATYERYDPNQDPRNPPDPNAPFRAFSLYTDVSIEDATSREVKTISSSKEKVIFHYIDIVRTASTQSSSTVDAGNPSQTNKFLDKIEIYDHNDIFKLGYQFTYTDRAQSANDFEGLYKLKKIEKIGFNGKSKKLYRAFNYYYLYSNINTYSTPFTLNQDVFGFPNNSQNDQHLNLSPLYYSQYDLTDRMPHEQAMINGMLKNIVNENGGKTEYFYKENSYNEMYFGGLLVSKINFLDSNNDIIKSKEFEYKNPNGFGLPVYDTTPWQENNTGGYEEGYWNYQAGNIYNWQSFFTRIDPLHSDKRYIVSSSPYVLQEYNIQAGAPTNLPQQRHGFVYMDIIEKNLNPNTQQAEYGYIRKIYKPSYRGFSRSGNLERVEYYSQNNTLVKQVEYGRDEISVGQVSAFRNDNLHFNRTPNATNSKRYSVNPLTLTLYQTMLSSVETINFQIDGTLLNTEKQEFDYLQIDSTIDYYTVKESRKFNNGDLVNKVVNHYLLEYFDQGTANGGLFLYVGHNSPFNPIFERDFWHTTSSGNLILNNASVYLYDDNARLERVNVVNKNPLNNLPYTNSNFTPSSFASNGNFNEIGRPTLEYTRLANGKVKALKNLETGITKIFQYHDYNFNYPDAVLTTRSNYNFDVASKYFLKKSFENDVEENTLKTSDAFSGNNVFIGSTLDIGSFDAGLVVSYWYYKNNEWMMTSFIHSGGNVTINMPTGAQYIDEVIVKPKYSTLMSMTYDELIGLTSQLNERGLGNRIKYDVYGRPRFNKDESGNVLNETRYNSIND